MDRFLIGHSYPIGAHGSVAPCTAYSIGSNNKWNFEEDFFRSTNCSIETFDCTCNVTIPTEIVSRTRFWPTCIGSSDSEDKKFLTFKVDLLLHMVGVQVEQLDYSIVYLNYRLLLFLSKKFISKLC